MGFFKDLLGGAKKREVRETTDDKLNAILAPIRDSVADFKDRTKMSFTHLLPAINSVGIKLLVKSRGLESAQRLYRVMINDLDAKGGIPVGSHMGVSKPTVAPEDIAELTGMLWNHTNDTIARGKRIEHVAQAYTSFAMLLAERAASGGPWPMKYLMAEPARELQIDFRELDAAQAEQPLRPPFDLDEPARRAD